MNKKQLILFSLCLIGMIVVGCNPDDPIKDPDPVDPVDTTSVVDTTWRDSIVYDTLIVDTIRFDTLRIDTEYVITKLPLQNDRVVLAYVPYYNKALPDPNLVTHINYMGAELYVENGEYKMFALQCPSWADKTRLQKVVALKKKNPNLKVMLSFTHTIANSGNSQGGGFSTLAASDTYRKKFAQDCLDFCKANNLDGIDLDWEFPTVSWSGHACSPDDKANFTLLMKQLRETLGKDYLLTYAAYVMNDKYIDDNAVEPYVNFINVMCYDICSAPQPHNSMSCSGYWDIIRTYQSFQRAGYNMSKFVLGVPFYGRHTYEDGEWYYWKLMDYYKNEPNVWKEKWSDVWKVPYATKNGEFWCSYDNPRSIAYKGEWLLQKGLKGMMYWEVSGDDDNHTLSRAVWESMKVKMDTTIELHEDIIEIPYADTIYKADTIKIPTIIPRN